MAVTWEWLRKKNSRLDDECIHGTIRRLAWDAVLELWKQGIYVLVTQGFRTVAEQDELYAQGRTKPGKIVTNAPGSSMSSFHQWGLALDFALYTRNGDSVVWDEKVDFNGDKQADWMQVVQAFKKRGFKWGGDFRSIKDTPHFEMTFGLTLKDLRAGKRPPADVVNAHEPVKVVVTTKQKKGEEYMIPVVDADKIISVLQVEWAEANAKIKQLQESWKEENAKPNKCMDRLDSFHKGADALRAEQKELERLADEVRKASGRHAQNV